MAIHFEAFRVAAKKFGGLPEEADETQLETFFSSTLAKMTSSEREAVFAFLLDYEVSSTETLTVPYDYGDDVPLPLISEGVSLSAKRFAPRPPPVRQSVLELGKTLFVNILQSYQPVARMPIKETPA